MQDIFKEKQMNNSFGNIFIPDTLTYDDKAHDECGIVGLYGVKDAAQHYSSTAAWVWFPACSVMEKAAIWQAIPQSGMSGIPRQVQAP